MICSEKELDLGGKHDGIMILNKEMMNMKKIKKIKTNESKIRNGMKDTTLPQSHCS